MGSKGTALGGVQGQSPAASSPYALYPSSNALQFIS